MQKLYKSHANPIARIVCGLPTSWELSVATMKFPEWVSSAAWSPCSRFIAIALENDPPALEILDAMTLVKLFTFEFPVDVLCCRNIHLVFSLNGHLLTWFGEDVHKGHNLSIFTWDIQTGVLVSSISPENWGDLRSSSVTYSTCGTIFVVLSGNSSNSTIHTYNALSGAHMHSHPVEGKASDNIWTYGGCLQFATIRSRSITVWEVGSVSTYMPTEVETLSIPDSFDDLYLYCFLPHPTLPQFALQDGLRIYIWSTQDSKFLLNTADPVSRKGMSFSPDGHFFICIGIGLGDVYEIHLWKGSPTGYVFHQRLMPSSNNVRSLISPNGESIIVFSSENLQLWHTTGSSNLLSLVSAQTSKRSDKDFIVRFSPDDTLAAVMQWEDEMIMVLDLKSGISWPIINAGMKVYGVKITGTNITAVGNGKGITWNLPTEDHILNLRADITNSFQVTTFNEESTTIYLSPNLCYIAKVHDGDYNTYANIYNSLTFYDTFTGQSIKLRSVGMSEIPWFTPDECELWCGEPFGVANRWKIIEGSGSGATEVEDLGSTTHQPVGPPWQSSCGYQVTDDWWIISSSGKRLLWLPPDWRSYYPHRTDRVWNGQFLALLHRELPEAVILELE